MTSLHRLSRVAAELARMGPRAGRAPSRRAWRLLTIASRRHGFDGLAHASWCGRLPAVIEAARLDALGAFMRAKRSAP